MLDEEGTLDERHTKVLVKGYPVYMITVSESIISYIHKFIETDDPNLEIVLAADMIEKYRSEINFSVLFEKAMEYGDKHYQVLRAIVALRACMIWSNS